MKEDKKIAWIDLETTGIDVKNDKIVQIGIIIDDEIIEYKINPMIPIPKSASDIHKILDKDVENCKTFEEISEELFDILDNKILGGYNIINFDYPLLKNEFRRIGIDFETEKIIDVFNIWKNIEDKKLTTCYFRFFGERFDNSHDAISDIKATKDIYFKIKDIYKDIDIDNLSKEKIGKFIKNNKFRFGKHNNKNIIEVWESDRQYIVWILGSSSRFPKNVKDKIKKIIKDESEKM